MTLLILGGRRAHTIACKTEQQLFEVLDTDAETAGKLDGLGDRFI